MRTLLVALAVLGCRHDPQELHVGCGASTKALADTHWKDADLLMLPDGSERQTCAGDYDVTLWYENKGLDAELGRVTALLAAKGFHEVPLDKAPARVAASSSAPPDPAQRPSRVFVKDEFQVAVTTESYPANKGAPFMINLGMFVSK